MPNEPPIDLSHSEKPIRFDVTCTTDTGKRVNIEMQAHRMAGDSLSDNHLNLRARSIYYTSKLFILQKAKRYKDLHQTFHIMVCDFNVFDDDRFMHRFTFSDGEITLSEICCIIYVELPKIKDRLQKPFDEMTDDERWAVLIEYIDDEKFKPKAAEYESKEAYRMAMRTLTTISNDEKQQINYLSYLINEMDYESNKSALEDKGRQEGRQEGLLEGIQQGLFEGEQKAKLNSARRMLLGGLSPADVAKFADLPIDTIRAIQIQRTEA